MPCAPCKQVCVWSGIVRRELSLYGSVVYWKGMRYFGLVWGSGGNRRRSVWVCYSQDLHLVGCGEHPFLFHTWSNLLCLFLRGSPAAPCLPATCRRPPLAARCLPPASARPGTIRCAPPAVQRPPPAPRLLPDATPGPCIYIYRERERDMYM